MYIAETPVSIAKRRDSFVDVWGRMIDVQDSTTYVRVKTAKKEELMAYIEDKIIQIEE